MGEEAFGGYTHSGALLADGFEMRITRRCLEEDLGQAPDASFADLEGVAEVDRFVRQRRDDPEASGVRDVNGLQSGKRVPVFSIGARLRGGTWFDSARNVLWLVAVHEHDSGSPDDFFPFVVSLDREGRLFPDIDDIERLLDDGGTLFATLVRIEAPLMLNDARKTGAEVRKVVGGRHGVGVAVESYQELEETYLAIDVSAGVRAYEDIPVILAAFKGPDEDWEAAERMPSRDLREGEIGFRFFEGG